jgi:hypothetical protein
MKGSIRLIGMLTAVAMAWIAPGKVKSAAPAASPTTITQAEAETFVKSFYRDIEEGDLDKVMAHFDETVDYYTYGSKDKAFVADQIRQYFESIPVRFFSVGDIKLRASSAANRVSVAFKISFSIRSRAQESASIGQSQVDWDLVKQGGVLKIVRFTGTSVADASQTAPK